MAKSSSTMAAVAMRNSASARKSSTNGRRNTPQNPTRTGPKVSGEAAAAVGLETAVRNE